ncbi:cyclin-like protein [Phaffia rhodozyma]|uniref:Cyclin-like protein n=1 Tax=Phaffia rhodozyma TaxID=264483 RepID=A0A0F7SKQ6_PHARH|nr:cyclin-like protein [Phaffia rhodozyma]
MAANFWASSHAKHWLFDRATLDQAREIDLKYASKKQLACLSIHFANLLQRLGKRLQLRQRPIATSIVYFRRFYLKNAYCDTDPYLVLATCSYVAAKLEETPVHIKSVVVEARSMFNDLKIPIKYFPSDNAKVAEMEFYLLEDLDFHLTVFHPYRALAIIAGKEKSDTGSFDVSAGPSGQSDIEVEGVSQLSRGTGKGALIVEKEIFENAWFMVNDTYRTDLCLLYPPYIIAIACLYIAMMHFQSVNPKKPIAHLPQNTSNYPSSSTSTSNNTATMSNTTGSSTNESRTNGSSSSSLPSLSTSGKHSRLPPAPKNHPLPMNPLLNQSSSSSSTTNYNSVDPTGVSSTLSTVDRQDPTLDIITYISSISANFSLVAQVVQEILSLWPLWDAMEGSKVSTSSGAGGLITASSASFSTTVPTSPSLNSPTTFAAASASLATTRDQGKPTLTTTGPGGGSSSGRQIEEEHILEGQMSALVEKMRTERAKDKSSLESRWPVTGSTTTTTGGGGGTMSGKTAVTGSIGVGGQGNKRVRE